MLQKNSQFGENDQESLQNRFFWHLSKILSIDEYSSFKKWCITVFIMILQKIVCLGKISFFSYGLKCSQPIRLWYSLIISISGRNEIISQNFCMEINMKEKQHVRLPLFVWCGQFYFSAIQIAGFFDHQYLWKKSINIFDFLYRDNHQRKVAPETTTFDWVWPAVPLGQSDCRIL